MYRACVFQAVLIDWQVTVPCSDSRKTLIRITSLRERSVMAHCNGRQPVGPYPSVATRSCNTLARHNIQHRNCDQLRGLMMTALTPPICCGHICRRCVDATRNACQDRELALFTARLMPLCKSCQYHEASRNPEGYSSCDCDWNLSRSLNSRWKCIDCRRTALENAIEQRDRTNDW